MKLKYAVLGTLAALPFLANAAATGTATINVSADVMNRPGNPGD